MSRLLMTVTGVTCTGYESRIAAALGRLDGVRRVEADRRAGTLVVDYDAAILEEPAIRQRLIDAGYEAAAEGAAR